MTIGKLCIEPEALLLLALLYYLDDSGITLWVLLACACHEFGHWWMIHILGGQVRQLRLSGKGAELSLSGVHPLSPPQMCLSALAGPMVNLLLAMASIFGARHGYGGRLYFFAGLNLGLAGFNLLPISWLDGGKALEGFLCWIGLEEKAQRILRGCSDCVVLLLFLLGGVLFLESGGKQFTLLIAGSWMALITWREKNMNG